MLLRPRLGFALLSLVIVTKSAIAQEQKDAIPSLLKPADAAARMNAQQTRETEAYTLGVQPRSLVQPQPGGTWMVSYDLASLDDWLFRSAVGWKHVWGDLASETLFPMVRTEVNGQPLTGKRKYTLHFPKGQLPPARYWRISMYDLDGFFVGNPIRRYGIGNMAEKLEPNPDGSLTIHIQNQSPDKAKEANWLPAPKEGFFLMMRLYQPEEKMYRGAYVLRSVQGRF